MKTLFRMAVGVCAAFVAAATAYADPPSFPLLCRGGPQMRIMTNHDVSGAGIPGATAMFVYFRQGHFPGSVRPPAPGECTWMDRTLNDAGHPGEPLVMWIKSPNVEFAFQVMGNGRVVVDGTGPRLNAEGATLSAEAHDWDTIVRSVLTHQLFTVQVYNSHGASPVMVITHVGP